jgi:uncharacterized iron-regulated protein
MAKKPIVLLGETHSRADDHRWQLHTLAALHARNPNMVIAFEAFPRKAKRVLDRWIRGELSEQAFLRAVRWYDVWGFDPDLYLPLFHFARLHRVPMMPMNVDRTVIRNIRKKGWDGVAEADHAGIGRPAPASPAYRTSLDEIYRQHDEGHGRETGDAKGDGNDLDRFVDAQITWDRAMAEALLTARGTDRDTLVVGIVGQGHLEYRYGIPHQLEDMGENRAAVLLPWAHDRSCADLTSPAGVAIADAVFGIPDHPLDPQPPKPRLGVLIETAPPSGPAGSVVRDVADGSVAAAAGLRSGDVITQAAGTAVADNATLIDIIARQAPGTWLPLTVSRDGKVLDFVARFPTARQAP